MRHGRNTKNTILRIYSVCVRITAERRHPLIVELDVLCSMVNSLNEAFVNKSICEQMLIMKIKALKIAPFRNVHIRFAFSGKATTMNL